MPSHELAQAISTSSFEQTQLLHINRGSASPRAQPLWMSPVTHGTSTEQFATGAKQLPSRSAHASHLEHPRLDGDHPHRSELHLFHSCPDKQGILSESPLLLRSSRVWTSPAERTSSTADLIHVICATACQKQTCNLGMPLRVWRNPRRCRSDLLPQFLEVLTLDSCA